MSRVSRYSEKFVLPAIQAHHAIYDYNCTHKRVKWLVDPLQVQHAHCCRIQLKCSSLWKSLILVKGDGHFLILTHGVLEALNRWYCIGIVDAPSVAGCSPSTFSPGCSRASGSCLHQNHELQLCRLSPSVGVAKLWHNEVAMSRFPNWSWNLRV